MAADILVYKAAVVPVGDDQDQHLELTRTLARSFNGKFSNTFPEPKVVHTKTPRVMSLDDPTKKMSKSAPSGCLFLTDAPEVIRKKISRAITDSETTIAYSPEARPGISNLITIFAEFMEATPDKIVKKYAEHGYAEFKRDLADVIIKKLEPFQTNFKKFQKNKKLADSAFKKGGAVANKIAEKTLREAKQKIGLL